MDIKEKAKEAATNAGQEIKQEAQAVEQEVDKIAAVVHAWFVEHIHNSIASRETEIFNHLHQAKDELVKKIKEALA